MAGAFVEAFFAGAFAVVVFLVADMFFIIGRCVVDVLLVDP